MRATHTLLKAIAMPRHNEFQITRLPLVICCQVNRIEKGLFRGAPFRDEIVNNPLMEITTAKKSEFAVSDPVTEDDRLAISQLADHSQVVNLATAGVAEYNAAYVYPCHLDRSFSFPNGIGSGVERRCVFELDGNPENALWLDSYQGVPLLLAEKPLDSYQVMPSGRHTVSH